MSTTSEIERIDKQIDNQVKELGKKGESEEERKVFPFQNTLRNLHAFIPYMSTKKCIR